MLNILRAAAFTICLLSSLASAAPPDPRSEVTIRVSEADAWVISFRFKGQGAIKMTTEDESGAYGRISKALGFSLLTARYEGARRAAAAKGEQTFAVPEWSTKAVPRKLARDAVEQLIKWLVPTPEHPVDAAESEVTAPIVGELREVLAGRDPYR